MPEHTGYHDGDENYNSSCCIGCCRAGDFGTHDGCGPCDCRRSFKQDHDQSIHSGWSLGQYYPGENECKRSSSVVNEGKSKKSERFEGSTKTTEQQTHEVKGKGVDDKVAIDKSIKTSETAPKETPK